MFVACFGERVSEGERAKRPEPTEPRLPDRGPPPLPPQIEPSIVYPHPDPTDPMT